MRSKKVNATTHMIVLERDELVIETLTRFCEREGIVNAALSAIGAVKGVTCGYYALKEKKYYFTEYPDIVEVASMTGNVMRKEGRSFIHAHSVFTNEKNEAFGGHVQEMSVAVVLEVCLQVFDSQLERELDEDIGLFVIRGGM